ARRRRGSAVPRRRLRIQSNSGRGLSCVGLQSILSRRRHGGDWMRTPMSRFARIVTLTALVTLAAAPAAAQTAIPDFRGTWKGESHSIVSGGAHPHHPGTQANEPRFDSTAFTLTVDKQDG